MASLRVRPSSRPGYPVEVTLCPPGPLVDFDALVTARPRDLSLALGSSRAPTSAEEFEGDDISDLHADDGWGR